MSPTENGVEKKEKKPKVKKMTKDAKQTLVNEKIEELMTARNGFNISVIEWEEAHARAGELKKTMERRQAIINGIVSDIDAIRSGNYTPMLFNDEATADTAATEPPKPIPGTLKFEGDPKKVLMSQIFEGKKRILKAFADADIRDVKELGEYTSSGKKVGDLKGMGATNEQIVTETMINFWSDNSPK